MKLILSASREGIHRCRGLAGVRFSVQPPSSNVAILLDEDETTATSDCEKAYADELVAKGYQPGFYLNPGDFSGSAYCGAIDDTNVANAVVWSDEQEIERTAYDRDNSPSFNPEQPNCGSGLTTYGWQYIQPNAEQNYGQGDLTQGYDCDEVAPDRTSSLWLP